MLLKLANIRAGYAEVYVAGGDSYRLRHVGEVYRADEIIDGRGGTVSKAGWVPVTLSKIANAEQPRYPRYVSRQAAAWALVHGEVTY